MAMRIGHILYFILLVETKYNTSVELQEHDAVSKNMAHSA